MENKSKNQSQSSILYHLQNYVKKKVNLADFIERETGCRIIWYEPDVYAGTVCPMPHHKEGKASFKIKLMEDDVWTYHCFGCGVGGTIINFCMDYHGLKTWEDAVRFVCKKMDIKTETALAVEDRKDTNKKIGLQRKMECAHVVTANQCRNLLRKDYARYNKWVANTYKRLNEALDSNDIATVENIGFEVSNKIGEK